MGRRSSFRLDFHESAQAKLNVFKKCVSVIQNDRGKRRGLCECDALRAFPGLCVDSSLRSVVWESHEICLEDQYKQSWCIAAVQSPTQKSRGEVQNGCNIIVMLNVGHACCWQCNPFMATQSHGEM